MPPQPALKRREAHRSKFFDDRLHADLRIDENVGSIDSYGICHGKQRSVVVFKMRQLGVAGLYFIGECISRATGVDKNFETCVAFVRAVREVGEFSKKALEVLPNGAIANVF